MNTETSACGFLQELSQLESCRENFSATFTSRVATSRSSLTDSWQSTQLQDSAAPSSLVLPWKSTREYRYIYIERERERESYIDFLFFSFSPHMSRVWSFLCFQLQCVPALVLSVIPSLSQPQLCSSASLLDPRLSSSLLLSNWFLPDLSIPMSYTSHHSLFSCAALFAELMFLRPSRLSQPQTQPLLHMLPGCLSQVLCSVSLFSLLVSISVSFYHPTHFWTFKPLSFDINHNQVPVFHLQK